MWSRRSTVALCTSILASFVVRSAAAEDAPLSLHLYVAPSTAPSDVESTAVDNPDVPKTEGGLVEFLATRFSAHEPIYFVWGPERPSVKFQISLKYRVFGPDGELARAAPWISNFYLGYSQTSFWDIESDSSPFFDTSYRPQVMYQWTDPDAAWLPRMSRFDVQAGLQHESNGKSGPDSRSLNIVYVRPVFTFGDPGTHASRDFFVAVAPRLWCYVFGLRDNPDIADFRGYGDLELITGWRGGLQAAMIGRMGDDWDKGSFELDMSYPLRNITRRTLDLYLYAQFSTGYGESLLGYNDSDTSWRVGLALVR
jgi:phospholipase A1